MFVEHEEGNRNSRTLLGDRRRRYGSRWEEGYYTCKGRNERGSRAKTATWLSVQGTQENGKARKGGATFGNWVYASQQFELLEVLHGVNEARGEMTDGERNTLPTNQK